MKRSIFIVTLALCWATQSMSQGLYFRLGGGYGMGISRQTIGTIQMQTYDYTTPVTTSSITQKNVYASYGAGLNFTLGTGYTLSETFALEVGLSYFKGKEAKIESLGKWIYTGFTSIDIDRTIQSSHGFLVNPTVVFTPIAGTKVPYTRIGAIIGFIQTDEQQYRYNNGDGTSETTIEGTYKNKPGIGFNCALGMNWMIHDKMDLFTEINFIGMNMQPSEFNVTKYINNGTNSLPQLSTFFKKTLFEETVTSTPWDPNKPNVQLREPMPFGSLSLRIGITYLLKGHGEK